MSIVLKKYWWVIIVAIIAPIILNFVLLCPSVTPIVGDNIAWLSFWGGYLGAIISSTMAFIILLIQYKQNHAENEANRKLQINILSYQQEIQWLNALRKACADLLMEMNKNIYIEIIQKLRTNPSEALQLARQCYDVVGEASTAIGILCYKPLPSVVEIDKTRNHAVELHRTIIGDVIALIQYYNFDFDKIVSLVKVSPNASEELKTIINRQPHIDGQQNILNFLVNCIMLRAQEIPKYSTSINESFNVYLAMEQRRLDNILNVTPHEK